MNWLITKITSENTNIHLIHRASRKRVQSENRRCAKRSLRPKMVCVQNLW
jgi:hypothetical protein